MSKPFFLGALAACGLLAHFAFLQLNRIDAQDAEGEEYVPPEPLERLEVTVRVVDADTGAPLKNTECVLHRVYFYTTCIGWNYTYKNEESPARRSTGHDGQFKFSAGKFEDSSHAEAWGLDVSRVESQDQYLWKKRVSHLLMPVPEGYRPVTNCEDAAKAFATAFDNAGIVELKVRACADLNLIMLDKGGKRVDGAEFQLQMLTSQWHDSEWLEHACAFDDWTSPPNWPFIVDEWQATGRLERIRARTGDVKLGPPGEDEDEAAPEDGKARPSTAQWTQVPSTTVGILASHPEHGHASLSVTLRPGMNHLEIQIPPEPQASIHAKVIWSGTIPTGGVKPTLSLRPTGPSGRVHLQNGFWDDPIERVWQLPDTPDGAWNVEFTGIEPGWWLLCAHAPDDGGHSTAVRVELPAGSTKEVTIHVGPEATARWYPEICLDGQLIPLRNITLIGGEKDKAFETSVVAAKGGDGVTPLQLTAGTWKAWVPGFAPLEFLLEPGEDRHDTFDTASVPTTFTIDEDLFAMLGGRQVKLVAAPRGCDIWKCPEMRALLAPTEEQDPYFAVLAPGKPRTWLLPPGEYRLYLDSRYNGLGLMDLLVQEGVPKTHRFALDEVMGMKPLRIELQGFDPEDMPSVEVMTEPRGMSERVGDCEYTYSSGPDIAYPHESYWLDHAPVVSSEDERICLAFVPPGPLEVEVDDVGTFTVSAPGTLVVKQGDHPEKPKGRIMLKAEGDDEEDDWVEDGPNVRHWFDLTNPEGFRDDYFEGSKVDVPQGPLTAHVFRVSYDDDGRSTKSWAETVVEIGTDVVWFDVNELEFQPFAVVDFTFRGRADAGTFDPWWDPTDDELYPYLLALDDTIEGSPRKLVLGGRSYVATAPIMEFGLIDRTLPAGRYKLVPWIGAPEETWQQFTVKAGEHKTVVVEMK